jgi:hypothetical protein
LTGGVDKGGGGEDWERWGVLRTWRYFEDQTYRTYWRMSWEREWKGKSRLTEGLSVYGYGCILRWGVNSEKNNQEFYFGMSTRWLSRGTWCASLHNKRSKGKNPTTSPPQCLRKGAESSGKWQRCDGAQRHVMVDKEETKHSSSTFHLSRANLNQEGPCSVVKRWAGAPAVPFMPWTPRAFAAGGAFSPHRTWAHFRDLPDFHSTAFPGRKGLCEPLSCRSLLHRASGHPFTQDPVKELDTCC